jgi:hypothetical protein
MYYFKYIDILAGHQKALVSFSKAIVRLIVDHVSWTLIYVGIMPSRPGNSFHSCTESSVDPAEIVLSLWKHSWLNLGGFELEVRRFLRSRTYLEELSSFRCWVRGKHRSLLCNPPSIKASWAISQQIGIEVSNVTCQILHPIGSGSCSGLQKYHIVRKCR